MRARFSALMLLVAITLAPAAQAQDVEAGRRIAEQWCKSCHNTDRTPRGPMSDTVPSFAAVARMPSATQISLTAFLMTPHAAMPNYSLTRQEIRDVVAYILSLRDEALIPTKGPARLSSPR